MSDSENEQIEVPCNEVKLGEQIYLRNRPCELIKKIWKPKSSLLRGIDMIKEVEIEEIVPNTMQLIVPKVVKQDCEVVDINHEGDTCTLMNLATYECKEEVRIPSGDLGHEIKGAIRRNQMVNVGLIVVDGEERIYNYKLDDSHSS
eukprot:TRINITY_DN774193_c0_g1_i1.p1 TRINITY_DN774193_c0_g1~~TRINITY_DN774193_c0_g1_i1.p1  ORF type:complete len:146 (-),score=20.62 TRINITY_DN774193_c0_g1_i1:160-597(-)